MHILTYLPQYYFNYLLFIYILLNLTFLATKVFFSHALIIICAVLNWIAYFICIPVMPNINFHFKVLSLIKIKKRSFLI